MAPHIPGSIDAKLLGLYLSDHLTGATAGVSRIQRMTEAYADTPVSADIARVSAQIEHERDLLQGLIRDLGVRQRPHRQAAAWLAEHAGRLKLNGRIVRRSPMTMVLEAELMRAAVLGKLGGWETLEELAPDLGLDRATFRKLGDDARGQVEALGRVHEHARRNAFRRHGDITT
ncbi:hypothetical protein QFZ79_004416 [Arthrobacter sp. V4I6]|uniref:hypothetical protein n=1 Tax=unclassified Arthrobacter TaxID=235627 RepID=UPI0027841B5A|nr:MULTISPECIES: hypothetical protein [unclassified Arthrobacter]MDQ0822036.1 hypothetical protein [Arthrobacter sp. V1I7]MDQ0856305.1 hypothetical protein [Arthrobacter sp. V4I6]